jgi:hypothetical protein
MLGGNHMSKCHTDPTKAGCPVISSRCPVRSNRYVLQEGGLVAPVNWCQSPSGSIDAGEGDSLPALSQLAECAIIQKQEYSRRR